MTDAIAERVRKVGARTLTSVASIMKSKLVLDNDADFVCCRCSSSNVGGARSCE